MAAPKPLLPRAEDPPPVLAALGVQLRAQRKRLKVSAVAAAEAAGISRVTLHRIERGEPSVAMGAWLAALDGVGLALRAVDPRASGADIDTVPARIALADHPQLRRLTWQLPGVTELTPDEALELYERNWRHLDQDAWEPAERALVRALAARSGGRLLVRP